MNVAVFLDKDGTLIPDIPYNVDPELIVIQDNALDGLRKLKSRGYLLILISNQAGVAWGYFGEAALEGVKDRLQSLLEPHNAALDGVYFCPHHPEGTVKEYAIDCNCRKPKAGLFIKAARDFNIDLSRSWMIGDILHDVEAANRAGCRSILIDNGNETEWYMNEFRKPDYMANNINDAANHILYSRLNRESKSWLWNQRGS